MVETTLQPEPVEWRSLVERPDPAALAEERLATRDLLGLPVDRRVIATGHQAEIWHPGILAKDLAAAAVARTLEATGVPAIPLHFIADHDANDGGLLAYPTREIRRAGWRMLPAGSGRSLRDRSPATPTPPPSDGFPDPHVEAGLQAVHDAILRHRDAENLASQLGRATADLARPCTGPIERRSMSGLLETPIGGFLLRRMARDPSSCILAHDEALEADRQARAARTGRLPRGVARPLGGRAVPELPLWRDTPEGRRPVRIDEPIDPRTCRPRALLATALARLGPCDLFIHGTGGGLYDRVMESWLERWLGVELKDSLAPAVVATATLRLPIPVPDRIDSGEPPTPEGLHRLLSDPDLERSSAPIRPRLLRSIDRAPRGGRERREAYLALRAEVERARRRGHDRIEIYRRALLEGEERRRRLAVARDRTWAFPLHAPGVLGALSDSITGSFEAIGSTQASSNGLGR